MADRKQKSKAFVIQEGFQTFPTGDAIVSHVVDPSMPEEFQNFENLTRKLVNVSKAELDAKRREA